jgi:hypothetical protein
MIRIKIWHMTNTKKNNKEEERLKTIMKER